MRAIEFLIEYNRAKTEENFGQALYKKILTDRTVQRIFGDDPVELIDPEVLVHFIIQRFEEADPTPNKQYVQWIVRTYVKGRFGDLEDIIDGHLWQSLTKFNKLVQRKKIPSPRNDINIFTNFSAFIRVMQLEYPDPDDPKLKDKGNAFTLYDDENFRVIVPQDEPASCYYGQGSQWCTSGTKGNNMFNYYNGIAPILIVLPKKPKYPGEKYQLHFGVSIDDNPMKSDSDIEDYINQDDDMFSDSGLDEVLEYGQIMDERDQPVTLGRIENRMGPSWDGMIDAYLAKFPDRRWQLYTNFDAAGGDDESH
jgi:hypothetical protein